MHFQKSPPLRMRIRISPSLRESCGFGQVSKPRFHANRLSAANRTHSHSSSRRHRILRPFPYRLPSSVVQKLDSIRPRQIGSAMPFKFENRNSTRQPDLLQHLIASLSQKPPRPRRLPTARRDHRLPATVMRSLGRSPSPFSQVWKSFFLQYCGAARLW